MYKSMVMLGLLFQLSPAMAESQDFESGSLQTQMIELYTSQGCSSCPPAEEYLNQYTDDGLLWKRYIPIAFHVDYWDYLGWKDQYASAENSKRQVLYAKLNKVPTVYTPGFIVNGKEWRGWRYQGRPQHTKQEVGRLSVSVLDDVLRAQFTPRSNIEKTLVLHYALLGMGLVTEIAAGENRGRHSRHDFVVLIHKKVPGRNNRGQSVLPAPARKASWNRE